jgi:hypothetical protein
MDLSRPDGYDHILVCADTTQLKKKLPEKKVVTPKSTILSTRFHLVNETSKKVHVLLKKDTKGNPFLKDTIVVLLPKQEIHLSGIQSNVFLNQHEIYEPEFTHKAAKKKYKAILAMPVETMDTKTYTWHIIKTPG